MATLICSRNGCIRTDLNLVEREINLAHYSLPSIHPSDSQYLTATT